MLTLGADEKKRPSADSLKGTDVRAVDTSITLSSKELPVSFTVSRPSKTQIQFDGKTYERQVDKPKP